MCLHKLLNIFKKSEPTTQSNSSTPNIPPTLPLTLPHPEEPVNPDQTVANTPISDVFQKWYNNWFVPEEYREYWRTAIDVQVYDSYPPSILAMGVNANTPGVSWAGGGKRYYACLAPWFNPGVTAHEQAHNSYALLSEQQKIDFESVYQSSISLPPVDSLHSKKP